LTPLKTLTTQLLLHTLKNQALSWKFFSSLIPSIPHDSTIKPGAAVLDGLACFCQGYLPDLYQESLLIVTTAYSKPTIFDSNESPCPSAQLTANEDNLHTSFAHLKSTLPNTKITKGIQILI
jgi:hypothetical protein